MVRRPSTTATISEPAARPRGGLVHRLLLHGAIPLTAALVVAWGVGGLAEPPPVVVGSLAATPAGNAEGGAPGPVLAVGSTAAPPAVLGGTAVSPPILPAATMAPATPIAPTSAPVPTALARPSPRPSATPPQRRTPTPVGGAVARACVAPSPLPPVVAGGSLATTAEVNFRSGPGVGCDALALLGSGTEVTPRSGAVRAGDRSWLLVEVGGRMGWVAEEFLGVAVP